MTTLDALDCFLSHRLPSWGICGVTFFPEGSFLRLDCRSDERWAFAGSQKEQLAALDIGVASAIVTRPDSAAFVVEMSSSKVC